MTEATNETPENEVVERVVAHAVFTYVDPEGIQRMAVRGDVVRVSGAELARGERFEVFAVELPELAELVDELAGELSDLADDLAGQSGGPKEIVDVPPVALPPEGVQPAVPAEDPTLIDSAAPAVSPEGPVRPPLAANKDAWVAFRKEQARAELVTEDQLIKLDDAETTKLQLQDDEFIAGLFRQA